MFPNARLEPSADRQQGRLRSLLFLPSLGHRLQPQVSRVNRVKAVLWRARINVPCCAWHDLALRALRLYERAEMTVWRTTQDAADLM